jgi:AcrR family transcriptional regulator
VTLVDTPVGTQVADSRGPQAASAEAGGWAPGELRLVDAALRCIARWGVAKTTLDDVAREAGCSRATVYRVIPGGKDGLLDLVAQVEIERFFAGLGCRLESATDLETLLAVGLAESARRIRDHAGLQYLLAHEPEAIVPHLAFTHLNQVLSRARVFAEPWLARWLPAPHAARASEWVTRLVLSYSVCPADGLDVADEEGARRLVQTYILPGLRPFVRT